MMHYIGPHHSVFFWDCRTMLKAQGSNVIQRQENKVKMEEY